MSTNEQTVADAARQVVDLRAARELCAAAGPEVISATIAELARLCRNARADADNLKGELKAGARNLADMTAKRDVLLHDHSYACESNAEVREALAVARDERDEARRLLKVARESTTSVRAALGDAQRELDEVTRRRDDCERKIAELSNEHAHRATLGALPTGRREQRASEAHNAEVAELVREINTVVRQRENIAEQHCNTLKLLTAAEAECADAKRAAAQSVALRDEHKRDREHLTRLLDEEAKRHLDTRAKLDTLEREITAHRTATAAAGNFVKTQARELSTANLGLAGLREKLREAGEKIKGLELNRRDLTATLDIVRGDAKRCGADMRAVLATVSLLRESLRVERFEAKDLRTAIRKEMATSVALRAELAERCKELRMEVDTGDALAKQIDALKLQAEKTARFQVFADLSLHSQAAARGFLATGGV